MVNVFNILLLTPAPLLFKASRGPTGHQGPKQVKMSPQSVSKSTTRYAMAYDFSATDDDADLTLSTQFSSQQCRGYLVLYRQTYLRGLNLTTSEDIPDLQAHDFDDKVTSLEVSGTCCWVLFSEPHYRGHSQQYQLGQYKSAADIGQLFRDVSSVKKIVNC